MWNTEVFCHICEPGSYSATVDPSSLLETCFWSGWCRRVDIPGGNRLMLCTNQTIAFEFVYFVLDISSCYRQAFYPLSIGNKGGPRTHVKEEEIRKKEGRTLGACYVVVYQGQALYTSVFCIARQLFIKILGCRHLSPFPNKAPSLELHP